MPRYSPYPVHELDSAYDSYLLPVMINSYPLVVYHAHCMDGIGAAYCVWLGLKGKCYLLAQEYNKPPICDEVYHGRKVIIVDFCFPVDQLVSMEKSATSIEIYDHHAGLAEDVGKAIRKGLLRNTLLTFNNNKSGVRLAWENFMQYEESPAKLPASCMQDVNESPFFVNYIEDRDLWRFNLVNTEAFCAAFAIISKDIVSVHSFLTNWSIGNIINMGELLVKKRQQEVESFAAKALPVIAVNGKKAMLVNAPLSYASELGDYLCKKHAGYFAIIYECNDLEGRLRVSMRSRQGHDIDVAAFARTVGGGGHKNAAGCTVSNIYKLVKDLV